MSYALTDRGRVLAVNGLKEGQGVTYLGGVKYGAGGEMVEGRMGDGALRERKGYNAMGQMTEMEVTAGSGALIGRLTFDYGVSGNNGNLRSQGIETPGRTVRQYYGYDFVNRLRIAWEGPGMGSGQTGETVTCGQLQGTWCERMGYDGFGNAWDAEKQQATGLAANGPAWYLLAGNRVTNQMKDVVYDAAGNQTQYLVGSVSRVADYDGEGRIWRVRETGSAPVTVATYFYNAEGWRVKRVAGGVTTYFVYDEQGQAVAEYQEGSWTGSGGTKYWYTDHLGTTRMRVKADGTEVSRQDYEPFGGEIVRTGAGYGGAEVGRRFTGKERDGETGLDYFGARYMSAAQATGRNPITTKRRSSSIESRNGRSGRSPRHLCQDLSLPVLVQEGSQHFGAAEVGELQLLNRLHKIDQAPVRRQIQQSQRACYAQAPCFCDTDPAPFVDQQKIGAQIFRQGNRLGLASVEAIDERQTFGVMDLQP